MKLSNLIIFIFLIFSKTHAFANQDKIRIIQDPDAKIVASPSFSTNCVYNKKSVYCWGDSQYGQAIQILNAYKNIKKVEVNEFGTCVLDEDHLWCHGHDDIVNMPYLSNIKNFSLGSYNVIVLDDSGFVSWGRRDFLNGNYQNGKYVYYDRENIFNIIKNVDFMTGDLCVGSKDSVACWGIVHDEFGTSTLDIQSDFKNTREFVDGNEYRCVLTNSTVKCSYPYDDRMSFDELNGLNDVKLLAGGRETACVVISDNVRCSGGWMRWYNEKIKNGDSLDAYIKPPESFKNIRQLAVGYNHVCAWDDNGINCWGYKDSIARDFSHLDVPLFIKEGSW